MRFWAEAIKPRDLLRYVSQFACAVSFMISKIGICDRFIPFVWMWKLRLSGIKGFVQGLELVRGGSEPSLPSDTKTCVLSTTSFTSREGRKIIQGPQRISTPNLGT